MIKNEKNKRKLLKLLTISMAVLTGGQPALAAYTRRDVEAGIHFLEALEHDEGVDAAIQELLDETEMSFGASLNAGGVSTLPELLTENEDGVPQWFIDGFFIDEVLQLHEDTREPINTFGNLFQFTTQPDFWTEAAVNDLNIISFADSHWNENRVIGAIPELPIGLPNEDGTFPGIEINPEADDDELDKVIDDGETVWSGILGDYSGRREDFELDDWLNYQSDFDNIEEALKAFNVLSSEEQAQRLLNLPAVQALAEKYATPFEQYAFTHFQEILATAVISLGEPEVAQVPAFDEETGLRLLDDNGNPAFKDAESRPVRNWVADLEVWHAAFDEEGNLVIPIPEGLLDENGDPIISENADSPSFRELTTETNTFEGSEGYWSINPDGEIGFWALGGYEPVLENGESVYQTPMTQALQINMAFRIEYISETQANELQGIFETINDTTDEDHLLSHITKDMNAINPEERFSFRTTGTLARVNDDEYRERNRAFNAPTKNAMLDEIRNFEGGRYEEAVNQTFGEGGGVGRRHYSRPQLGHHSGNHVDIIDTERSDAAHYSRHIKTNRNMDDLLTLSESQLRALVDDENQTFAEGETITLTAAGLAAADVSEDEVEQELWEILHGTVEEATEAGFITALNAEDISVPALEVALLEAEPTFDISWNPDEAYEGLGMTGSWNNSNNGFQLPTINGNTSGAHWIRAWFPHMITGMSAEDVANLQGTMESGSSAWTNNRVSLNGNSLATNVPDVITGTNVANRWNASEGTLNYIINKLPERPDYSEHDAYENPINPVFPWSEDTVTFVGNWAHYIDNNNNAANGPENGLFFMTLWRNSEGIGSDVFSWRKYELNVEQQTQENKMFNVESFSTQIVTRFDIAFTSMMTMDALAFEEIPNPSNDENGDIPNGDGPNGNGPNGNGPNGNGPNGDNGNGNGDNGNGGNENGNDSDDGNGNGNGGDDEDDIITGGESVNLPKTGGAASGLDLAGLAALGIGGAALAGKKLAKRKKNKKK